MKQWRDVNVIYQIYPRSFRDTNGDGVGDLRGIIERLDYLKGSDNALGVDAIWISPFFMSPMRDMGYDISDYLAVDPLFGTLDDFRELIAQAHARDIRVLVDFVPNHTSDQHAWFQESRSSRDNTKADYYIWHDARDDGSEPNNWQSIFGGSMWQWDDVRQQYYLHTFLKEQPDLNWQNPAVRDAMKAVVRFWLQLGADGVRVDAVRFISKDPQLRDNVDPDGNFYNTPGEFAHATGRYSEFGPDLPSYLAELATVFHEFDDKIILFEDYPDARYRFDQQFSCYYQVDPVISRPFVFEGMRSYAQFDAAWYRQLIDRVQGLIGDDVRGASYCFSNHDRARLVTRFGGELPARLIAMLQLTLPGLPVIYYGEELGMTNATIAPDEVRDSRALQLNDSTASRDPMRTPMRWDGSEYAGFSDVAPWLPLGDDVQTRNVVSELADRTSFLALYRQLLVNRRDESIYRHGIYRSLDVDQSDIFAYEIVEQSERKIILLNFAAAENRVVLPAAGRVILSTDLTSELIDSDVSDAITLTGYQGVVISVIP